MGLPCVKVVAEGVAVGLRGGVRDRLGGPLESLKGKKKIRFSFDFDPDSSSNSENGHLPGRWRGGRRTIPEEEIGQRR